jgi:hypothetical protein
VQGGHRRRVVDARPERHLAVAERGEVAPLDQLADVGTQLFPLDRRQDFTQHGVAPGLERQPGIRALAVPERGSFCRAAAGDPLDVGGAAAGLVKRRIDHAGTGVLSPDEPATGWQRRGMPAENPAHFVGNGLAGGLKKHARRGCQFCPEVCGIVRIRKARFGCGKFVDEDAVAVKALDQCVRQRRLLHHRAIRAVPAVEEAGQQPARQVRIVAEVEQGRTRGLASDPRVERESHGEVGIQLEREPAVGSLRGQKHATLDQGQPARAVRRIGNLPVAGQLALFAQQVFDEAEQPGRDVGMVAQLELGAPKLPGHRHGKEGLHRERRIQHGTACWRHP